MAQANGRRGGVLAAALGGVLMSVAPAHAAPAAAVAWSTYLRAGPGQSFEAVTELEHDTPVQVLGCAGGWCRVVGDRLSGYVDRDALALPRTVAPSPPAHGDCVVAGQADDRRPIATRFCSAPAAGG